jgi:hypothetical protein
LSHTSSPFALVILEIGSPFLLRPAYTYVSTKAVMTGIHHSVQQLVEMGSHFCVGWPGTAILLILASQHSEGRGRRIISLGPAWAT